MVLLKIILCSKIQECEKQLPLALFQYLEFSSISDRLIRNGVEQKTLPCE